MLLRLLSFNKKPNRVDGSILCYFCFVLFSLFWKELIFTIELIRVFTLSVKMAMVTKNCELTKCCLNDFSSLLYSPKLNILVILSKKRPIVYLMLLVESAKMFIWMRTTTKSISSPSGSVPSPYIISSYFRVNDDSPQPFCSAFSPTIFYLGTLEFQNRFF